MDAEAKRIYESTLWSSEAQFANCKVWRAADAIIGVSAAVAAAIAGVAGLAELISAQWAGGIAIVSAALGAVNASLGAARIASDSTASANLYRNLQQDVRIFYSIEIQSLTPENARTRLKALVERQQELNVSSPVPLALALWIARKNIERGGQSYEADES